MSLGSRSHRTWKGIRGSLSLSCRWAQGLRKEAAGSLDLSPEEEGGGGDDAVVLANGFRVLSMGQPGARHISQMISFKSHNGPVR